ncbi:MAG: mitochondrial fission ELM1 family protein [Acetobacter sp.]|uniref:mitochondrial fission ELM1 family protein n=1 Tax=Acetobacter sp. TaxID=440 RepID=UPI0039EAC212
MCPCDEVLSAMPYAPSGISVVAEDLAGMRSQAFGLAEYVALPTRFHSVQATGLLHRCLPSSLWPHPLRALSQKPDPLHDDLVFSVAGKGGAVGAAMHRSGRHVVQIQNPRIRSDRFDLVIANYHDEIDGPNVLLSRTALHGLTAVKLAEARSRWRDRLNVSGRPLLAVLVGGANGRFRFGREEAESFADRLASVARRTGANLFITTSRRTAPEATAVLRDAVESVRGTLWSGGDDNPYRGLIACADWLVVTADSVSMVSEAVASVAPVYVQRLPGKSRRIGLFLETLEKCGRIRMFEGELERWPVQPLDDTPIVADEMCRRLGLENLFRGSE